MLDDRGRVPRGRASGFRAGQGGTENPTTALHSARHPPRHPQPRPAQKATGVRGGPRPLRRFRLSSFSPRPSRQRQVITRRAPPAPAPAGTDSASICSPMIMRAIVRAGRHRCRMHRRRPQSSMKNQRPDRRRAAWPAGAPSPSPGDLSDLTMLPPDPCVRGRVALHDL